MINQQDELDLYQLFKVFWKYKKSIVCIIAISIFFGIIFNVFYKHKYEVSVKTNYNYYPISVYQQCQNNQKCMKELSDKLILSALEYKWIIKREILKTSSSEPLNKNEYHNYFDKLNTSLLSQINSETSSFLDYLDQTNLNENHNETITNILLYSKYLTDQINAGIQPVTFRSLEIKRKNSEKRILLIAFIVGFFLSLAQSLFRNNYKNNKNIII